MNVPFVSVQTWKYFKGDRLEDALGLLANAVSELTDDDQENICHIDISRPDDDNPFYTAGCLFSWKEQK